MVSRNSKEKKINHYPGDRKGVKPIKDFFRTKQKQSKAGISEYKRTQERLAKLNECLLSFGTNPDENINRLVALCGEELGAICALYNRLKDGMLHSVGQWNTPPDYIPVDKPDGHICYDLIQSGKDDVCLIRDLPKTIYAETDPNVMRYGLKTYIGKTVSFGGTTIGSLCAVYQKDYIPNEDDKKFLEISASAIGVEEKRKGAEEAMQETERLLTSTFTSIQDGISILDKDMNILQVNQTLEKWYSHAMPFVGKKCYEAYHSRKEPCDFCPSYRTIKTGEAAYEIVPKRGPDGKVIGWLDLYSFPFIDLVTGKMRGVIEYVRDTTERKRTEEALRQSEEEAKPLSQENTIVAEIGRVINSSLKIEEVYERFAEEVKKLIPFDRIVINLTDLKNNTSTTAYIAGIDVQDRRAGHVFPLPGSTHEHIIRTRSILLIQTEDEAEVAGRFPSLLSTFRAGLRSMISVPLISKDEVIGVLHLRSTKSNAYSERELRLAERVGNQIAGAIANAQLFAERERAEEALQKSEERFKELYDNAPLGYHEFDAEGRIIRVNRTELEILGYTAEEMLGRYIWDFIVEEISREAVKAKLAGKLSPGRAFERTYRRKDGTTFPVLIEDRLLEDDKGRIIGIRSTIQDITERKRAEEQMNNLQDQLRQSQKIEAIGRLAGGIAHDFNNLLTVIKGYSELSLIKLKEGDPLKENIEEIHRASQRATDLTQQLLAFSRRQILEFKVLDLNIILQDLDKMLHRLIGEDIELVYLLSDHLGKITTDPGQIEQMILNLAVNARDAMPSGGKLTIETANVELDETYAHSHIGMKPGRYVMLSLSDTGCGMSPEAKEHLFEPFFTTKEKGKGTGLGLSTVYGIVKQSEGDIRAYSEPGQGTTFKIYLPRVEEETSTLPHEDDKDSLPQGSETVLLVEDELSVRGLALQVLRENGYNLLEAANGNEALRMAQEYAGEIHLLLTDVVMPQMGGKELADQLKSLRPDIKVLFISGYTDNAIVHHGVLEPNIDFLQKPFSPVALAQKVRKVLDK